MLTYNSLFKSLHRMKGGSGISGTDNKEVTITYTRFIVWQESVVSNVVGLY